MPGDRRGEMADPGAGSKYLRLARSLVAERLRERGGPENGASAASKGPENGPGAVQGAEDGSAARAPPPPGRARRKLSFRGAKGEEDCSLREAARRDQASVLSDRSNAPIPREAGDPLAAMHARAEERRKRVRDVAMFGSDAVVLLSVATPVRCRMNGVSTVCHPNTGVFYSRAARRHSVRQSRQGPQ